MTFLPLFQIYLFDSFGNMRLTKIGLLRKYQKKGSLQKGVPSFYSETNGIFRIFYDDY